MQDSSFKIELMTPDNASAFWSMLDDNNYFQNGRVYYERCAERHANSDLDITIAAAEGLVVGYALLNWQPKYAYFKKCDIPEIQDLKVISAHRRQGIGKAMIEFCEVRASKKGYLEMGIGVGLDSSFGAAQRLYARLGYIPDGSGVSYDRKQVAVGEFRPLDENLCLMMSKLL